MREKKLIVIAGPTASGKTALGIALAGQVDGEIVSADSMQIYRGMDVGTAKATAEEQAAAKHHMLDLIEPGENYSVSRYVEDATQVCEDLFRRGNSPSSWAGRDCISTLCWRAGALPGQRTRIRR